MSDKILTETRRREQERMRIAYEKHQDAKDAMELYESIKQAITMTKLYGNAKKQEVNIYLMGASVTLTVVPDQYGFMGWS